VTRNALRALTALILALCGFALAQASLGRGNTVKPAPVTTFPTIRTLPTITIRPPTTRASAPDLAISKSDSPDPVFVGAKLTYAIKVTNNGPGTARLVKVTDTLPPSASLGSASASQGNCSSGGTVVCDLNVLETGASATVTITVTPNQPGVISNTASVSGSETPIESNTGNNSATERTEVKPLADVALSKAASPPAVFVAQTVTYKLTAANSGPSGASDVTVTDGVPQGVSLVSASASQGSCSSGATVTCNLGSLAKGSSASVTIKATATQAGAIANTGSVKADEDDPNGGNNTASAEITVKPRADLALAKLDAPDPVLAGKTLTYTLKARNGGPSDASGVTITDTLPPSAVFVSSKPACTHTGATLKCALGALAKGAALVVQVEVTPTQAGGITNTATVSGVEDDPDAANNHATATTRVRPAADLSLAKTDAPDPVGVGGQLVYVLAIANKGPSPTTGVKAIDSLPSSVEAKSAQASQGACVVTASVVKCSLGKLAKGGAATITIKVKPAKPGTIVNTASVSADAPDPEPANNKDTAETQVKKRTIQRHGADLSLRKIASLSRLAVHGKLIYTLIVTNGGPDKATAVTVVDKLPHNLALLAAAAGKGGCNGKKEITCKLGSLDVGALAKVTLVIRAKAAGRIANTAVVTGHDPDPTPDNNTALSTPVTVTAKGHGGPAIVPTLVVRPPLGPPGFVTRAFGRDFPANASVVLTWHSGLGRLRVVADRKGRFEVPVLIFHHDLLGPRELVADPAPGAPGFRPPRARFLVVQGTLQPPRFQPRG
jgi:uncharacterized repeat protein (TIGR01451 family)